VHYKDKKRRGRRRRGKRRRRWKKKTKKMGTWTIEEGEEVETDEDQRNSNIVK